MGRTLARTCSLRPSAKQTPRCDGAHRHGPELRCAALRCRTSPHGARTSELQSAFAECRRLTSRGAKGLSAAREEAQEFVLNVPRPRADCETSRREASLLHQDLGYVGAGGASVGVEVSRRDISIVPSCSEPWSVGFQPSLSVPPQCCSSTRQFQGL